MQLTKTQILIITGIVVAVLILGLLIWFGLQEDIGGSAAALTVWGVFDDGQAFQSLIGAFKEANPKADIKYRNFTDPIVYENELLNALAAGTGPDIFMFHNTWLPKHYDKVVPFPHEQLNLTQLRELFPGVVEQDFSANGFVYALPLSVDTMAMFYSKDDFDSAAIVFPPRIWTEFEDVVSRLRQVNPATNRILKAAAAIGGSSKSINRASDFLALLMIQSGAKMTDDNFTRATFSQPVIFKGQSFLSGLTALNFYTQFANSGGKYYTWSDSEHYSLDAFASEEVSIIFNYAFQLPQLKQKNPFLNVGIALMPQPNTVDKRIDYSNYWGLAVSNKSANSAAAFDFVKTVTTNADTMINYANASQRPPALRVLINEKINDPIFGVFARQSLTARSWPQIDNVRIEEIFSNMIEAVTSGRLSTNDALKEAENSVTAIMQQRRGP